MPQYEDLKERSLKFALRGLEFYRNLPKTPAAQVPGMQFLKASAAVFANYRAARRARSRREFLAKLGTVVEEADECVGWLEYMERGAIASDAALISEARQLCAIFSAALRTGRRENSR